MRLLLCPILAVALIGAVAISQARAAGSDNMAPGGMQLQSANPASQPKAGSAPRVKKKATAARKKAPVKKSDSSVIDGYRQAYDLIYKQQNYAEAIVALRALNRDDHPDVANLIGFSSRKLGRTEDAKAWYEKALAADPNHTRTWQYYGMWHLERGDRAKAEEHLTTIAALCGTTCQDYTSLRDALDGHMTY
jgi:tetratricopeptide (TPR) repeat protein